MLTLHPGGPRVAHASDTAAEEWSRIWFNLAGRAWRSLALLSAEADNAALDVAERLLECARAYRSGPVQVIDARDATPGEVAQFGTTVADHVDARERVLLVVASPLVRASAIPLARGADGALLVVPLGTTAVREARRVVAAVGHAHFLGSITVRAE